MFDAMQMGALGAVLSVGSACKEAETRPDALGDCNDPECMEAREGNMPPAIVGAGTGVGGGSGAGGEGGNGGGMPAPQVGSIAGSIRMITEPNLLGSMNLDGEVQIRARGATSDEVSTEAAIDGTYRLDGVLPISELWVAVGAFATPPVDPFMDTLQIVDATMTGLVELLVMRQSVMEDIAEVAYTNDVVELDPTRGHAIVSFVDRSGNPVSGVQLTTPTSDDASVAYDAGDVYSDQLEETANRGTVMLLNLPATAYPGSLISVSATLAGVSYTSPVQIARGAVTVVSAQIGP